MSPSSCCLKLYNSCLKHGEKITKKAQGNTTKLDYNKQVAEDFGGTEAATGNQATEIDTTNNNNKRIRGYVQTSSRWESSAPLSLPQESFNDLHVLSYNEQCLHNGKWFYESISNADAKSLLQNSKHGTFLIRFSSSSKYLYSLSVSSKQGVTSVRIAYNKGEFHLDCDERLEKYMPHFKSIIDLVQFYSNRRNPCLLNNGHRCVWVDCNNKRYNSSELTTPKLHSVPSLAHLCRLSVNNYSLEQNRNLTVSSKEDWRDSLGLPKFLVDFMKSYPFVL
ncbi:suppressor of cytokine signaling 2-like [Octopus sinensis]|uniref:Suppressor of cytokine signaling 2-like n=1 Tax=Octopus sinensis TaxID=2607531 RepID=A0A7E6FKE0_9MOLL|nr:suppressor of cytokine signaling 2-like [Octopus sinensis]